MAINVNGHWDLKKTDTNQEIYLDFEFATLPLDHDKIGRINVRGEDLFIYYDIGNFDEDKLYQFKKVK